MVTKFHREDRIFLPGVVDDMGKVYERADIFVSSSRYESFGMAAAEAMAFGIPCVGFRECPGINEIVAHNQNGLLAEGLENPEKLAKQMMVLAKNHSLRASLGAKARSSVQKFHVSAVIEKWEGLIVDVARNG